MVRASRVVGYDYLGGSAVTIAALGHTHGTRRNRYGLLCARWCLGSTLNPKLTFTSEVSLKAGSVSDFGRHSALASPGGRGDTSSDLTRPLRPALGRSLIWKPSGASYLTFYLSFSLSYEISRLISCELGGRV